MKLDIRLLLGASAIALLSLGGTASAQDCPRGDLDERFCDLARLSMMVCPPA